ncbi:MAG: hypothetical protein HOV83_35810 [Catenulispora sp.]|nr:hypothetical protein [Catenulispora sp.]
MTPTPPMKNRPLMNAASDRPALTSRAVNAAHQRRDYTPPPAHHSRHWLDGASECARRLVRILGIASEHVRFEVDPVRCKGDFPWSRLTVTDTDGTVYQFAAANNDRNRLLVLAPCPGCAQSVPLIRLDHLADLGDLIEGQTPTKLAAEFYADRGHLPDCPHAATT